MKEKTIIIGEDKVQPHDQDTENVVLATLMRYNDKFSEYSDLLSEELFYQQKEKAIYKCIAGVINGGGITDINSLFNYAQSHDVGREMFRVDFLDIFQLCSVKTLDQDIQRLREMSKRRTCWRVLQMAASKVLDLTANFDDEVNGVMISMGEIHADVSNGDVKSFGEGFKSLGDTINDNTYGRRQGLMTGFELFDKYYLLRPNTLTVIAAFTSVGKSALAMNIAMAVARQNVPVAYYSLEMGNAELVSRAISKEMNLPSYVIMNKALTESQINTFHEVEKKDGNLPIYFDDRSTVAFDKTIRSIRTLAKTKGIKLAIIDYLQVYSQVTEDAEQSISYMARTAKNIAKELGIAVIVLSQLNRSALHPSIRMLRGSGQIEESADNIVLIDRPEAYPDNKVTKYEGEFHDYSIKGTAKLILAKGRGVGTGCSLLTFDGNHTSFAEREKAPKDGEGYREQEEDLPF